MRMCVINKPNHCRKYESVNKPGKEAEDLKGGVAGNCLHFGKS